MPPPPHLPPRPLPSPASTSSLTSASHRPEDSQPSELNLDNRRPSQPPLVYPLGQYQAHAAASQQQQREQAAQGYGQAGRAGGWTTDGQAGRGSGGVPRGPRGMFLPNRPRGGGQAGRGRGGAVSSAPAVGQPQQASSTSSATPPQRLNRGRATTAGGWADAPRPASGGSGEKGKGRVVDGPDDGQRPLEGYPAWRAEQEAQKRAQQQQQPPRQLYQQIQPTPIAVPQNPTATLYVKGLPAGVQASDVRAVFGPYGPMRNSDRVSLRTSARFPLTPIGHIAFASPIYASSALTALAGRPFPPPTSSSSLEYREASSSSATPSSSAPSTSSAATPAPKTNKPMLIDFADPPGVKSTRRPPGGAAALAAAVQAVGASSAPPPTGPRLSRANATPVQAGGATGGGKLFVSRETPVPSGSQAVKKEVVGTPKRKENGERRLPAFTPPPSFTYDSHTLVASSSSRMPVHPHLRPRLAALHSSQDSSDPLLLQALYPLPLDLVPSSTHSALTQAIYSSLREDPTAGTGWMKYVIVEHGYQGQELRLVFDVQNAEEKKEEGGLPRVKKRKTKGQRRRARELGEAAEAGVGAGGEDSMELDTSLDGESYLEEEDEERDARMEGWMGEEGGGVGDGQVEVDEEGDSGGDAEDVERMLSPSSSFTNLADPSSSTSAHPSNPPSQPLAASSSSSSAAAAVAAAASTFVSASFDVDDDDGTASESVPLPLECREEGGDAAGRARKRRMFLVEQLKRMHGVGKVVLDNRIEGDSLILTYIVNESSAPPAPSASSTSTPNPPLPRPVPALAPPVTERTVSSSSTQRRLEELHLPSTTSSSSSTTPAAAAAGSEEQDAEKEDVKPVIPPSPDRLPPEQQQQEAIEVDAEGERKPLIETEGEGEGGRFGEMRTPSPEPEPVRFPLAMKKYGNVDMRATYEIVRRFLEEYYNRFDSSRATLEPMYTNDALFSLKLVRTVPARALEPPPPFSRSWITAASKPPSITPIAITNAIRLLPAVSTDLNRMLFTARAVPELLPSGLGASKASAAKSHATPIHLHVLGDLEEFDTKVVRRFSRTFILVPNASLRNGTGLAGAVEGGNEGPQFWIRSDVMVVQYKVEGEPVPLKVQEVPFSPAKKGAAAKSGLGMRSKSAGANGSPFPPVIGKGPAPPQPAQPVASTSRAILPPAALVPPVPPSKGRLPRVLQEEQRGQAATAASSSRPVPSASASTSHQSNTIVLSDSDGESSASSSSGRPSRPASLPHRPPPPQPDSHSSELARRPQPFPLPVPSTTTASSSCAAAKKNRTTSLGKRRAEEELVREPLPSTPSNSASSSSIPTSAAKKRAAAQLATALDSSSSGSGGADVPILDLPEHQLEWLARRIEEKMAARAAAEEGGGGGEGSGKKRGKEKGGKDKGKGKSVETGGAGKGKGKEGGEKAGKEKKSKERKEKVVPLGEGLSKGDGRIVIASSGNSVVHGFDGKSNKLRHLVPTSSSSFLATSFLGDIVEFYLPPNSSTTHVRKLHNASSETYRVDEAAYSEEKDTLIVGYLGAKDPETKEFRSPPSQVVLYKRDQLPHKRESTLHETQVAHKPHTAGGVTAIANVGGSGRLRFVTGGEDKRIFLWTRSRATQSFSSENLRSEHSSKITSLATVEKKNWVVSAGMDKRLIVHDFNDPQASVWQALLPSPVATVQSLSLDPNLVLARMSSSTQQFQVHDTRMPGTAAPSLVFGIDLPHHRNASGALASTTMGRYLRGNLMDTVFAFPDHDIGVKLWDLRNLSPSSSSSSSASTTSSGTGVHSSPQKQQNLPNLGRSKVVHSVFAGRSELCLMELSHFTRVGIRG
ncbi:hypothetical protein JCM8547_003497 [Rhodosporidiobolus lusitaniae]